MFTQTLLAPLTRGNIGECKQAIGCMQLGLSALVRGMSSKAAQPSLTTPGLKFQKRYRYECSVTPTLARLAPKEKPPWTAPMPPWSVAREQFLAKLRPRPKNKERMQYDRKVLRLLQAEVCSPASRGHRSCCCRLIVCSQPRQQSMVS
jgi:hypothetical protein